MTRHDWLVPQSAVTGIQAERPVSVARPIEKEPSRSRSSGPRRAVGYGGRLLVLAVGTVLVASVGVGAAAIPDSSGVIHGCYSKSSGADDDGGRGSLRVIDTAKGEKCKRREVALSWSQTGPKGDPGVALLESDGPYPGREDSQHNLQNLGVNGNQGAQSTALWVNSAALQQSWVMCPPGKTALGGGYGNNDGGHQEHLNIVTSAPVQIDDLGGGNYNIDAYHPIGGDAAGSFVPNGWLVEGFYTGPQPLIVRPHVICADVNVVPGPLP